VTTHIDVALEAETRPERAMGVSAAAPPVPALTILFHPDLERIGERVLLPQLSAGREARLSRKEPGFSPPRPPSAGSAAAVRPLADPYLSRVPVRLLPAAGTGAIRLLCDETRMPVAVGGVPVAGERSVSAAELERGAVLMLAHRVVVLLHLLDPVAAPAGLPAFGMIGDSAALVDVRREVQRLAPLDVAVMLRGETGTGKELVARALHDASRRAGGPFLAINLAAVPAQLAAAELFGAARGAFTGAERARPGYFGLAAGGTLLLDEIGEAPPDLQPLLLRALEEREIQPVGGGQPQRVDLRLLAATDADLEAAVAAGRLRAPLLHRLASYEIRLPPLRQRRDDIGRLLIAFLRQELAALGAAHRLASDPAAERPWLPARLVARLAGFDWPGNLRQLRNVARQLAVAGRDAAELPEGTQLERLLAYQRLAGSDDTPEPRPPDPDLTRAAVQPCGQPQRKHYRRAEEVGEEELLTSLRTHRWRLQPAAASLGISRTALYERIERSPALRKASDLPREEIEDRLARLGGDLDAVAAGLEVSRRGLLLRMRRLGLGR